MSALLCILLASQVVEAEERGGFCGKTVDEWIAALRGTNKTERAQRLVNRQVQACMGARCDEC